MAKTTAPLLSFSASGQIGSSQVYATWKGRAYARRYVVPANPQTVEQTKTRSVFSWLQGLVKFMPALVTAGWDAYASNSRITRNNSILKVNLPNMRGQTDLAGFTFSPPASSGLPIDAVNVAASDGALTVTITPPSLPDGWAITSAIAAAIPDQNPQTESDYTIIANSDNAAPYEVVLNGLKNGTLYRVGAWCTYTKADGSTAYGAATMTSGTPAA